MSYIIEKLIADLGLVNVVTTHDVYKYILEVAMDDLGLVGVMETVGEICQEKAQHLVANWQDEATAAVWEHMAAHIEDCTHAILTTRK